MAEDNRAVVEDPAIVRSAMRERAGDGPDGSEVFGCNSAGEGAITGNAAHYAAAFRDEGKLNRLGCDRSGIDNRRWPGITPVTARMAAMFLGVTAPAGVQ